VTRAVPQVPLDTDRISNLRPNNGWVGSVTSR
jgi:hypothetical protein